MQKVICPKCGATAYATEAFCPACGEMLKGARSAPASPAAESSRPAPPPPQVAHPSTSQASRAVFPLSQEMLQALAEQNVEPKDLVFSLENEEGAVALAGTRDSTIVLRAGDMVGGYRGINVKVYPYGSISDIRYSPGQVTGKLQFTVHLFGGKPEVGRRARMSGQKKVEIIAAVPVGQAPLVYQRFDEMVTNLSEL